MSASAVVDVSPWEVGSPEPGGSDANVWLWDGDTGENALFKPVVVKGSRRQGEDWAEKVVEQVAIALGVPCARIRMATRNGRPGLLSYDLASGDRELQTGAVLISEIDDRLVVGSRDRLGHNLDNIKMVLAGLDAVAMPSGCGGFDQFCGYLVLDALVANRDRHEQNWSVLRDLEDRVTLAPSYDHGNSLGFNLLDRRRLLELDRDPELERWSRQGFADRFEGGRAETLVAFAHRALDLATPRGRTFWIERLRAVSAGEWEAATSGVAEMSPACSTFCLQLLTTNRRRLLDDV